MNKERRNTLYKLIEEIRKIRDDIEYEKDQEDDYRDSMPENLQYGERYDRSEECSDAMENLIEAIDDGTEELEEALG